MTTDGAADEFWRTKYLKILENSSHILQSNRIHQAKIKRINKNVRRISKQNQYFVQVLKSHGDDFGLHCPSVWEKIAYPGAISEPLLDAKAQMKKPPNAFFLYCKENRDSVKKLIREQPAGMFDARNEITRQLAKDWNALPQEEREFCPRSSPPMQPKIPCPSAAQVLAKDWNALPPEEREKYFEKYRDNIEQYEESIREERRKNKLMFAMSSSEEELEEEVPAPCHNQNRPISTHTMAGLYQTIPPPQTLPLTPDTFMGLCNGSALFNSPPKFLKH